MVQILKFILPILPPHFWYAANLDANYIHEPLFKFQSFELKKVGNISDMLDIAKITEQFLSGVFVAATRESKVDVSIEADTEDGIFRELEIDGVIIEIRAFDTSYFEIYSEDKEIMNQISMQFHESVICHEG